MPISPENKKRYPSNWKEVRASIQARAGNKCEICGVKNHAIGYRSDLYGFTDLSALGPMTTTDGTISAEENQINHMKFHASKGDKIFRIVCTVMHLDHQPENNDPANLKFGCQKCHNNYDAKFRAENRKNRRAKNL